MEVSKISFSKAIDLLKLADLAASRHAGVTLDDIAEEFGVHERTAQRMARAMTDAFPHAVEVHDDDDRRRRWRIREVPIARLRLQGADELEALETAIRALTDDGDGRHARLLSSLKARLIAALPPTAARTAEADADALLEAHGIAARPGPFVKVDPSLVDKLAEAMRGPFCIEFSYNGEMRDAQPYGILTGPRRYLVARQLGEGGPMRHFRLDRITGLRVTDRWFARDGGFDLQAYAARAFGAYQNDAEFGEVVWRFTDKAADRAAEWRFHPTQTNLRLPDGRLEVRFKASGWLEMAWHLLWWGDAVEVVSPEQLRALVANPERNAGVLP